MTCRGEERPRQGCLDGLSTAGAGSHGSEGTTLLSLNPPRPGTSEDMMGLGETVHHSLEQLCAD